MGNFWEWGGFGGHIPTPWIWGCGGKGGRALTTMLEGDPGTLDPREEQTLPGEVRGCWREKRGAQPGKGLRTMEPGFLGHGGFCWALGGQGTAGR